MQHKPAFILDLLLPEGSFDVNLSPDKREVFIQKEAAVMEHVKAALNQLWEPSKYTFQTRRVDDMLRVRVAQTKSAALPQVSSQDVEAQEEAQEEAQLVEARQVEEQHENLELEEQGETAQTAMDDDEEEVPVESPNSRRPPSRCAALSKSGTSEGHAGAHERSSKQVRRPPPRSLASFGLRAKPDSDVFSEDEQMVEQGAVEDAQPAEDSALPSSPKRMRRSVVSPSPDRVADAAAAVATTTSTFVDLSHDSPSRRHSWRDTLRVGGVEQVLDAEQKLLSRLDGGAARFVARDKRFDPDENVAAASLLERVFPKQDFERAEILGQFNLGFIVTRIHGDLFIFGTCHRPCGVSRSPRRAAECAVPTQTSTPATKSTASRCCRRRRRSTCSS
jgi:DNA mismatch repair ATPase MutL